MRLRDETKKSLKILNSNNIITADIYFKLLENCFAVLSGNQEPHQISSLYNSKPDVIKEVFAALLSASAEFVRNNLSKQEAGQFLEAECGLNSKIIQIYEAQYESNKQNVEIALINIGSQVPSLTDANCKIDYIIKTSSLDESYGPLFRISLQTEVFCPKSNGKELKNINFTCDMLEMQDLVSKLKDAVRHCERLTSEH